MSVKLKNVAENKILSRSKLFDTSLSCLTSFSILETLLLIVYKLVRSSQLLGPKPFPLDRMLAIFYVIVDHKVPPRSKILNQV
jgi:hypothetical protein